MVVALLLLGFCAFLCVTNVFSQTTEDVEGYYWREFNGEIPPDALEGGRDSNGKPIYIGQVYAIYIIPTKIYGSNRKVFFEYGGFEHSATSNIKILCTKHPEQFEWIQTNNDDIKSLTNKTLVIGGFEPGCTTYIGRTQYEGETTPGKALANNLISFFAGLYVTKDGKTKHFKSFEVLAYDKNQKVFRDIIDIRFSTK